MLIEVRIFLIDCRLVILTKEVLKAILLLQKKVALKGRFSRQHEDAICYSGRVEPKKYVKLLHFTKQTDSKQKFSSMLGAKCKTWSGFNKHKQFFFQNVAFRASNSKGDPPRLVVCKDGNRPTSGWILCDGLCMECSVSKDVPEMVVMLLQSCYA